MCGTGQDKSDSRNSPTGAVQGRYRFKNIFDADLKYFLLANKVFLFFRYMEFSFCFTQRIA